LLQQLKLCFFGSNRFSYFWHSYPCSFEAFLIQRRIFTKNISKTLANSLTKHKILLYSVLPNMTSPFTLQIWSRLKDSPWPQFQPKQQGFGHGFHLKLWQHLSGISLDIKDVTNHNRQFKTLMTWVLMIIC